MSSIQTESTSAILPRSLSLFMEIEDTHTPRIKVQGNRLKEGKYSLLKNIRFLNDKRDNKKRSDSTGNKY